MNGLLGPSQSDQSMGLLTSFNDYLSKIMQNLHSQSGLLGPNPALTNYLTSVASQMYNSASPQTQSQFAQMGIQQPNMPPEQGFNNLLQSVPIMAMGVRGYRGGSTQDWSPGSKVNVGFHKDLNVIGKVPTPGDYRPDVYLLTKGEKFYKFTPHYGIEKIDPNEAQDMFKTIQSLVNNGR